MTYQQLIHTTVRCFVTISRRLHLSSMIMASESLIKPPSAAKIVAGCFAAYGDYRLSNHSPVLSSHRTDSRLDYCNVVLVVLPKISCGLAAVGPQNGGSSSLFDSAAPVLHDDIDHVHHFIRPSNSRVYVCPAASLSHDSFIICFLETAAGMLHVCGIHRLGDVTAMS